MNDPLHILKEKSQPSERRLEAIISLLSNLDESVRLAFQEILADPEEHREVRSAVALAITRFEKDWAAQVLMRHVSDPDSSVRNYVIQALGALERLEVVPFLVQALKDPNDEVFASAAEALGRIGKPVVPELIKILQESSDDARCVAAWQLGEIRDRRAIEPLVEIVRAYPNDDVKALSIWALGEIGEGPQSVMEALFWAKAQQEPEVRLRAELAIKKIVRHTN